MKKMKPGETVITVISAILIFGSCFLAMVDALVPSYVPGIVSKALYGIYMIILIIIAFKESHRGLAIFLIVVSLIALILLILIYSQT